MRPRSFALATVALLVCGMGARGEDAAIQKELQAQYDALAQAYQNRETGPFEKVASPDAKYIDTLGKEETRETWLAGLKQNLANLKPVKVTAAVRAVQTHGEEATAIVPIQIVAEGVAPNGQEGKIDLAMVLRDTWVRGEDGWKLKTMRLVQQEMRLDGRTLRLPMPPEVEEARKQIQGIYDVIPQLYAKGEWAALEKALPADFAVADADGKALTPKEFIERVREGAKNLNDPIMTITTQLVALDGERARVVRIAKLIAEARLPGGKTARMRYVQTARDTWVRVEKSWKMTGSQELFSETLLDGKLIPATTSGN